MSVSISAKQSLRSNIKKILGSLTEESIRTQSDMITQKLLSLKCYRNGLRIGVYLSMKDEVQTSAIVQDIFKSGKHCFIPWYNKDVMKLVKLDSLEELANLPVTKWNIQQPADINGKEDALSSGGLDLVVVPGMAFTVDGKRLGRGKGYYDRFLFDMSQFSKNHNHIISTVGLAFREQIIDDIPCNENDFILDMVLSP